MSFLCYIEKKKITKNYSNEELKFKVTCILSQETHLTLSYPTHSHH